VTEPFTKSEQYLGPIFASSVFQKLPSKILKITMNIDLVSYMNPPSYLNDKSNRYVSNADFEEQDRCTFSITPFANTEKPSDTRPITLDNTWEEYGTWGSLGQRKRVVYRIEFTDVSLEIQTDMYLDSRLLRKKIVKPLYNDIISFTKAVHNSDYSPNAYCLSLVLKPEIPIRYIDFEPLNEYTQEGDIIEIHDPSESNIDDIIRQLHALPIGKN